MYLSYGKKMQAGMLRLKKCRFINRDGKHAQRHLRRRTSDGDQVMMVCEGQSGGSAGSRSVGWLPVQLIFAANRRGNRPTVV